MDFLRQTIEGVHKGELRLSGGFRPNGGSNPSVLYGNWIESVTRNGAGDLTVRLKKPFRNMDCLSKQVSLQLSTAADSKVQLGPYDKAAGTQRVFTITGTAAADIAANADNIVWLELTMRYGNVPDGSPNYDT
jgi:hypothetical protein